MTENDCQNAKRLITPHAADDPWHAAIGAMPFAAPGLAISGKPLRRRAGVPFMIVRRPPEVTLAAMPCTSRCR
jgi:hypothetical protein